MIRAINDALPLPGRIITSRAENEKGNLYNPLRGFTPDILTGQLAAYARGEIAPLAWVMEWLETHDDTISAVAPKAKAAVSRPGYDVMLKPKVSIADKPLADEQRAFLGRFYSSIEATDALEGEEAGGMRLLIYQIMDAYGKGYGAHHIVWRPLPGGELSATLIKVPTWFFEVTSGALRFLPTAHSIKGIDLELLGGRSAWMISKGRGVMLAGSIARMLKQIPLQDWLTYCDRHGMPAFLGKTNSQKGTPGWDDMVSAVGSIGSEFGAVINTGDMIEVLNLTGNGEIPYPEIVARMDRAQVMLWRGGDLSTISNGNAVGSNPQREAADDLDSDNAAWVEETLNHNLTRQAIAWRFGPAAPVLAEIKLRRRSRKNAATELAVIKSALEMGCRITSSHVASRLGIVEAAPGERAIGDP